MKRPAGKTTDGVKSRCALVKTAVKQAEVPDRVKELLCSTMASTLGQTQATRHPFSERMVAMIETVLQAEGQRLQKDVESKDTAFTELTPQKTAREAALEEAKTVLTQKSEALDQAKQAATDSDAAVKGATAAVKEALASQKEGDKDLEAITAKKTKLESVQKDSFTPLLESTPPDEAGHVRAVLDAGTSYGFDGSLMSTAATVLGKPASERSGFDSTCLEQLQGAFASAIAKFDEQLQAGAPGKAERAAAVERAEAAKTSAEAAQTEAKEKAAAAKEAKLAAEESKKGAAKTLVEFMPDLKKTGDALDDAKASLTSFTEGPQVAFGELKVFKEGDFIPPPPKSAYYEKINGLNCDRAIIDACKTAVAGQGDGRVSVEDAKAVFEKVADGNKETRVERWTLRYCLQEFKWTEAAHDWIIEECKKIQQEDAAASPSKKARTEGGGYYEVIDGFKCDRGIVDACREAMGGQGDGRVSVEDAQKVWAKAADGSKVTDAEKWTLRYCLSAFNWTRGAHDWLLEQLNTV